MEDKVCIFVRDFASAETKTYVVNISLNDTISTLKSILEGKTKIKKFTMWLSIGGKYLKDDHTLGNQNIQKETTVTMHVFYGT